MSYLVLARKYRPQCLEDVVGQEPIAATLRRAIESDRVAHAILFAGSRGVGKTSMARILAKALNCVKGPTPRPCNECDICRSITRGEDLDVIEIDGASNNRVDEIRELRDNVRLVSARSRFKIYIIDEIHMLSISAFNALLKTLEEPPPHVKFVFATTNPQKLPETIHSRCQRFDFRPISEARIRERLGWICGQEGIPFEEGALASVARAGRGSLRDSLTVLDQVVAGCEGRIGREAVLDVLGIVPEETVAALVRALGEGDARATIEAVRDVSESGRDLGTFVSQMIDHLRSLMLAGVMGREGLPEGRTDEEAARLLEEARGWDLDRLLYMIQVLDSAAYRMRTSEHPRVLLEAALLKLSRGEAWKSLREILGLLEGGALPDRPSDSGAGRSPSARRAGRSSGASGPGRSGPSIQDGRGGGPRTGAPAGSDADRGGPRSTEDAGKGRPRSSSPEVRSIEEVRERWPGVVDAIRRGGKVSVAAFLAEGEPARLAGDELHVTFAGKKRFIARHVETDEIRKLLADAFREGLGRSLRLVSEFQTDDPPLFAGSDGEPAPGTARDESDPAVKKVLDLFEGRIVGREE
jgi:DNA polymerase-3 subunit gamma/tau